MTKSGIRWAAAGLGVVSASYAAHAGITWLRYGRPRRATAAQHDARLDRFMPVYDVVERHHIRVVAPAAVTLDAAREIDPFDAGLIKAIFKGRQVLLRSAPDRRARTRGMLADMQSLGWVILDEDPGHEVIVGAVTKPWEANVTFRSIPADAFAAFDEPDYVKIAWTLRADGDGDAGSIFRTETRALATSASAREKFRAYWSWLSPGITLIRRMMLGPVKAEAERRALSVSAKA